MIDFQSVERYLLQLQDTICNAVEAEDGQVQFQQDQWERQEGGGGRSRTLSGGAIFEKADPSLEIRAFFLNIVSPFRVF